jgi:hypothetical protein
MTNQDRGRRARGHPRWWQTSCTVWACDRGRAGLRVHVNVCTPVGPCACCTDSGAEGRLCLAFDSTSVMCYAPASHSRHGAICPLPVHYMINCRPNFRYLRSQYRSGVGRRCGGRRGVWRSKDAADKWCRVGRETGGRGSAWRSAGHGQIKQDSRSVKKFTVSSSLPGTRSV